MDLTAKQWEVLEPLLPKPKMREDGRGRPWKDPYDVLNGIIMEFRFNVQSSDSPPTFEVA